MKRARRCSVSWARRARNLRFSSGVTLVSHRGGRSCGFPMLNGNGPGRRTACFCFPSGNETPGISRFLSGFVSIKPSKVGAPQEILPRISPDQSSVGAITELFIKSRVRIQIHGDPAQLFAICLFLVPNVPPVTPRVRGRWKRNIQINGERNSARSPYV